MTCIRFRARIDGRHVPIIDDDVGAPRNERAKGRGGNPRSEQQMSQTGFRHAVGQRYTWTPFLVAEMIDCTARRSGASCAFLLFTSDAMKIVHEERPVARHCHGAGRVRWCIRWVDPQR